MRACVYVCVCVIWGRARLNREADRIFALEGWQLILFMGEIKYDKRGQRDRDFMELSCKQRKPMFIKHFPRAVCI